MKLPWQVSGAGRMSRNQAFKKESIKDFIDKPVKGTLELAIIYGHPDQPPERRLRMNFDLNIFLKSQGPPLYGDNITFERDEPI